MPGSLTDGVCSLVVGCSSGASLLDGASRTAAGSVLDAFSSWLASGAAWLVDQVVRLASLTTSVDLSSGWFLQRRAVLARPLGLLLLAMLLAATIGAVLRQDPRRLARAWLVALPSSILAGLLGIQLVDVALAVSDELSNVVSAGSASGVHDAFKGLVAAAAASGAPALVTALISVLLIVGTVFLWLELVVRAAAIYLAVAFMPLALAGLIWPATAHMAKRLVELLAALIFSKFVIVATLTLGAAAITAAPTAEATVTGAAVLLLAAFAPYAVLRLVPIVEAAAVGHLEGLSHRPARAAQRSARAAVAAPGHPVVALLRARQAGGGSPGGPEPVLPQPIPERQPDYLPGEDTWLGGGSPVADPASGLAGPVASSSPGGAPSRPGGQAAGVSGPAAGAAWSAGGGAAVGPAKAAAAEGGSPAPRPGAAWSPGTEPAGRRDGGDRREGDDGW